MGLNQKEKVRLNSTNIDTVRDLAMRLDRRMNKAEFNNTVLVMLFFIMGAIGLVFVAFFDRWRGRPFEWGFFQIMAIPISFSIMATAILLHKGTWK